MSTIIKQGMGVIFILLLISCSPRYIRDAYLNNVVEQATEDQVTLQMGPPHEVKEDSQGGKEWRYRDYQPTYPSKRPAYCTEYILRFDANKILRDWKRRTC